MTGADAAAPARVQRPVPDAVTAPVPLLQRAWAAPAAVAVATVVLGLFPVIRTSNFYFWDDSAAVFLPTWQAAGRDLLSGTWPALRPDVWMGGNWAVEAQFGLWNPLNLLLMVVVALVGNLAAAATVVKIIFQVLLAVGAWALAREYGAKPWIAWAVAVALPFAGFTLYYDTATWIAGLMAFAWTPWFWWATRRTIRGALNPLVMFALGYLLMTNGNPYGALAAVFVLGAVGLEGLLARNWRGFLRIAVTGALVGATALVAYLPLVLSSDAGWRESSGVVNDGFLVPDLTMLAAASTPSYRPFIRVWAGSGSTVPLAYAAWFLLPILPWLDWGVLRREAARLAGVLAVFGGYLLLAIGPSNLWLFRWPTRLLEYVWLAAFVLLAVLLSRGAVVRSWRPRAVASGAVVVLGFWLAMSAFPQLSTWHLASLALHGVLVAALVVLLLRWPALIPPLLVGGAAVVLAFQLVLMPANRDVAVWSFPSRPTEYAERYADPVVQVATPDVIPLEEREAAWGWLLFGSMPAAAGVESTTSYTGIGNDEFSLSLCMNHTGATCAGALDAAFEPAGSLVPVERYVDALKARTVVVSNALVPDAPAFRPPAGWSVGEVNEQVTVFVRDADLPWPDARLAAVTGGVQVAEVSSTDTSDRVVVSTGPDGGALQVARLAWPGNTAEVNGQPVEVVESEQGLLEVPLPGGLQAAEVEVRYAVPGYGLAVPVLLLAVAAAVIQAVLWARSSRRRTAGDNDAQRKR